MKKAFLTALSCVFALSLFAQNIDKEAAAQAAAQANPNLSMARKATIEWTKLYDLQAEQAVAALKIQETKQQNLASIESLKTADMATYVQKRLSAIDIAEGELAMILDERQTKIFKQQQIIKLSQLEGLRANLKKQGVSETAINDQLANFDF